MGHITNEHLAKLWDFMASYNCKSEANPSDILEAFLECDEALSDLANERDHWQVMYANACGDQDVFKESIRLLDTENRRLEQKVRDQEKEIEKRRKEAYGLYKELDRLRDEKGSLSYQKIRDQEKEINQLRAENEDLRKDNKALELVIKRNIDDATVDKNAIYRLRKDNEALKHVIDDFVEKVHGKDDELQVLQKERDELKKDCAYMTNSRNAWQIRAEHAEAEAEKLKKKLAAANDISEETKLPDAKEEHTITLNMGEATYKILLNILSSKAFGASPEYMRDSLRNFCDDHRFCNGCPLRFSDCDFDNMSDEELEKSYTIAILSNNKRAWHGDATAD